MTRVVNRRIAFLGGKPLSARCLSHLHRFHQAGDIEIVAVLPRPKGELGWWSKPGVPEIYETAEQLGLNIITHQRELLSCEVDLGISVLYHRVLLPEVLEHTRNGFLNLHCAPLPHYRGCNSCSHAILNGATQFGATIHYMDEKVDHGDVVKVALFDVPPDVTARGLMAITEEVGFRLFRECVPAILINDLVGVPQPRIIERDRVVSRYYPRSSLSKPGVKEVDLRWPAEKIDRHVRALEFPPFEPAYAIVAGRKVYLATRYSSTAFHKSCDYNPHLSRGL